MANLGFGKPPLRPLGFASYAAGSFEMLAIDDEDDDRESADDRAGD